LTSSDADEIRPATRADLPGLVALYNHYVEHSHVTFDVETFTVATRTPWFDQFDATGPLRLLVAGRPGEPVAYACSTPFKPKAAYEISVETTVYVHPDHVGRGLGRRVYTALLDGLADTGLHGAYGAIALPNRESVSLHDKLGFRHVGTLREVGRKFGRLWDVGWYELRLGA
jgi:phosphinothricin acetyltransferase